MSERPDLRELVGDDVPDAELDRLSRADDALHGTPPAPEVPESLTARVLAIPGDDRWIHRRRRVLAGLAVAACVAGAMFGIGFWLGGDSGGVPAAEQITLTATGAAPAEAQMVINVLPKDPAGNWKMTADVTGLPRLPAGGYYEVWLTQDDEVVASCGRFVVNANGKARSVWLNAPYRFTEYDRWVVTAHVPGKPDSGWLLDGAVSTPA
jgi:hypothetical protein